MDRIFKGSDFGIIPGTDIAAALNELLAATATKDGNKAAGYFFRWGEYAKARRLLAEWEGNGGEANVLTDCYAEYAALACGEKPTRKPAKGGAVTSFAVGLWDQKVLEKLIERRMDAKLLYHLGNLHYDRINYDTAARCWTEAAALYPANAAVHRNLALYRYNKKKDSASALRSMEKAFALAGDDSRMLLELSQLYSA